MSLSFQVSFLKMLIRCSSSSFVSLFFSSSYSEILIFSLLNVSWHFSWFSSHLNMASRGVPYPQVVFSSFIQRERLEAKCCINCIHGKENPMERMNDNKCLRRIWLWKAIKKVFVAIQETLTKYWEGNPCLEIESNSSEGWRVIIVSLAFCFRERERGRGTSSCIIFLRFQFPSSPVVVVVVHWILCTLSSSSPLFLS